MQKALQDLGISGGEAVTRDIIKNIDADGDGQISYEEFLVAALDRKLLEHQKNIWWAFCKYDLDGDGRITAEEIRTVLGIETRESVEAMISEFDVNGDGFIDYSEFMMCVRQAIEGRIGRPARNPFPRALTHTLPASCARLLVPQDAPAAGPAVQGDRQVHDPDRQVRRGGEPPAPSPPRALQHGALRGWGEGL